jgi:porin
LLPQTRTLREARDDLAEDGLDIQIFATMDFSLAAIGRQQRSGAWVVRALLDATATFDGQKVLGWTGGTVHFGLQGLVGQSGVGLVEDLQTFDNIDTAGFGGVSEAWVQQVLFDNRLRLKAGRIEVNSEFAGVDEGAVQQAVRSRRTFLHSSMGYSPTIVRMPSYPRQSLGGLVNADLADWLDVAVGYFDATLQPSPVSSLDDPSEDLPFATGFLIGEVDFGWVTGPDQKAGRMSLGGWGLFGPDACAEPPCASRRSGGPYAVASQTVWRRSGSSQGVALFAQYGWAPRDASSIRHHGGAGVVWTGLGHARPDDMVGAGASWIGLADDLSGETAIEAFYRGQVHRYGWLQPDLQYIVSPGGKRPDGMVISLRIALDL